MAKYISSTLLNEQLDVFALAIEVNDDSKSGALMQELKAKGETLYSPCAHDTGIIEAHYPSGNKRRGRMIDGKFTY